MSEARKCDRCHGFYDIENEQQDRDTPYEFKGDYVNLHLWVARNSVRKDLESRWYDLCPKCMMELECWLNNNEFPTNCEPYKDIDCADRSNGVPAFLFIFILVSVGVFAEWFADKIKDMLGW